MYIHSCCVSSKSIGVFRLSLEVELLIAAPGVTDLASPDVKEVADLSTGKGRLNLKVGWLLLATPDAKGLASPEIKGVADLSAGKDINDVVSIDLKVPETSDKGVTTTVGLSFIN
jgi:hypothetical protein